MLAEDIAPTEIGKHANVIRAAQEDLNVMDVLVCGRCLHVFHFIEDYQHHKEQESCEDNENLRKVADNKPSIWAFSLWKAAQLNGKKELASTSSWSLYQTWIKLDESIRETWIVAGKTIQSFGKLGQGELQEMPVRITKTVVNSNNNNNNNATNNAADVLPTKKLTQDIAETKKPITPLPTLKNANRIAKRTVPGTNELVPEKVEKIVAKRFNPRRKIHEYMVKWDTEVAVENSWESLANLQDVPHFLEIFEKQLAKQKQTRNIAQANKTKAGEDNKLLGTPTTMRKLPPIIANNENSPLSNQAISSPTRPSRTSKTKAMDQVKQWVSESTNAGSTSPMSGYDDEHNENDWAINSTNTHSPIASGGVGGIKRKLNDSDANDSLNDLGMSGTTTNTMEDLEEDLIPSHTVKRLKNGNAISVEVKTITSSTEKEKIIKVNGTKTVESGANSGTITGEVITVGNNSADVIITQDSSASGVLRKPGAASLNQKQQKVEAPIRVLSKAESLVSNTGIVRAIVTSSVEETTGLQKTIVNSAVTTPNTRVPLLRTAANTAGRATPNTQVLGQRQQITRTPGGTIVQRKGRDPNAGKSAIRITQTPVRNTSHAMTQNRMIVSRTTTTPPSNSERAQANIGGKSVTPEEKIFNLSKSGDLKVTKKVMTREEMRVAQAQRQQQQRQPQSQVQIQKVQQIAPPRSRVTMSTAGGSSSTSPVNIRNTAAAQAPVVQAQQPVAEVPQEEDEHQAQLCPITGKLIGQEETQLKIEQEAQQQQLQQLLGVDQPMLTNEDGSPLMVRGEDGTIYQVAGKNAEGQTILVTQGPDGEQQFAYVAATEGEENQVLTLDNAVAEAMAQLPAEQQAEALAAAAAGGEGGQYLVQMTEEELAQHQAALQAQQQEVGGATTQLTIQTGDGQDGQEANIPAEVVQADLPSPGGTRRVVLLLSDGTFMMTEMHDDEFKALNIAT